MAEASVKVALRVRPLTAKEQMSGCTECIGYVPSQPEVVLDSTRAFTYDFVYGPDSQQATIFDSAVKPVLARFIEGYNATCLAYGQTGSGKTHTMGTGFDVSRYDIHNQGIIPRAIDELFRVLGEMSAANPGFKYQMFASFLELYNEELIDLLNPHSAKAGSRRGTALTIREDGQGGIYWAGIKEEPVSSPDELMNCLQKGSLCRTTGSTDMNLTSSRSHAIFSVILRQEVPSETASSMDTAEGGAIGDAVKGEVKKLNSKFHFVDLAGSERMKKTKAVGDRAKEGIAINSGLLAMGKVIHALNDSAAHVPYRDSKLTRLLQDSLGGNSQTLMIACVSGSDSNFGETLNTLNYASRARNIKNKVMINQDFQAMEIHQLRAEISRLKMELMTTKTSSNRGSLQNVSGDYTATGDAASRTRHDFDMLKSEYQQKELQVYRLLQQVSELRRELASCQAKLDSMLFEQSQSEGAGGADIKTNPIIERYVNTITNLQARVSELESQLAVSQGRYLAADSPLYALGSLVGGLSGLSGGSGLSIADPKVNETIEKAKREIKKDIQLIQKKRYSPSRLARQKALAENAASSSENETDDAGTDVDRTIDTDADEEDDDEEDDDDEENENPTSTEDEMLQMIDKIQNDIAVKEELVEQLERTQTDFHVMKEKYEDKLRQLQNNLATVQKQRDSAIKVGDDHEPKDKVQLATVKARYEEKIKKLSAEISDVRRKFQESQREIQAKRSSNEAVLRTMKSHIETLKNEKMRALKRMKEREASTRERELLKDQEIGKLRRREKKAADMAQKLERNNHMQKLMLKRRTEEQIQAQNKLKSVMALLRKTKAVQSPIAKKAWRGTDSPRRSAASSSGSLRGDGAHSGSHSPGIRQVSRTLFGPSQESLILRDEERLKTQATFKKSLIDNQIASIIGEKHRMSVAEELVAKREVLAREKHDLSEERDSLDTSLAALGTEGGDKASFLTQQRQEVLNRLEIVEAEMKYCSARIKAIQIDATNDQTIGASGNDVSGLENALEIVNSLDPVEAVRVVELMLEDNIALRVGERAHQIENQQLKRDIETLRGTIEFYRSSARPSRTTERASNSKRPLSRPPPSEAGYNFDEDFDAIESALGAMASPAVKRPAPPQQQSRATPDRERSSSMDMETRRVLGGPVIGSSESFDSQADDDDRHARRVPSLQGLKERSGNIFERLHREQTVASQAKMKEHISYPNSYAPPTSLSLLATSMEVADDSVQSRSPTTSNADHITPASPKEAGVQQDMPSEPSNGDPLPLSASNMTSDVLKDGRNENQAILIYRNNEPAPANTMTSTANLDREVFPGDKDHRLPDPVNENAASHKELSRSSSSGLDIDSLTAVPHESPRKSDGGISDDTRSSSMEKLMSLRGSIQRAMFSTSRKQKQVD